MRAEVDLMDLLHVQSHDKRRLISVLASYTGKQIHRCGEFREILRSSRQRVDKYKKAIDDPTLLDSKYMADRRRDVHDRTMPRHGDKYRLRPTALPT